MTVLLAPLERTARSPDPQGLLELTELQVLPVSLVPLVKTDADSTGSVTGTWATPMRFRMP
jgi:hypothetical protein